MADDNKTDPPADNKSDEEKAAESFWAKLDERIDAGIERGIKTHIGNRDSRTGRSTLPDMIANFMFGKPQQQGDKKS